MTSYSQSDVTTSAGETLGATSEGVPQGAPLHTDQDAAVDFISKILTSEIWLGHALIWTQDPATERKRSHWSQSLETAKQGVAANASAWSSRNVYLGMGMSGPQVAKGTGPGDLSPYRRLLAEPAINEHTGAVLATPSVHFIPGVWADIDYGEEGHKSSNGKQYAPDLEAVLERLPELPSQPTITIHSGHGLQLFWTFAELLDISLNRAAAKDRQSGWIALLRESFHPYALDSVIDLTRVMRLPGFNNKNPDRPVPVKVIAEDGPTTTPSAVDEILSSRNGDGQGRRSRKATSSGPDDPAAFDPDLGLDTDKFQASYNGNSKFAQAWDRKRPDLTDQSPSGYDMALANAAAVLGWSEQEIIDLLVDRRRKAGAKLKGTAYYERTVRKALDAKYKTRGGSGRRSERHSSRSSGELSAKQKEVAAVEKYIHKVKSANNTVYWLQDFYQVQNGRWRRQSPEFFLRQLSRVVARARGSDGDVVIARQTMANYLESLARSATPPCIDTSLLEEDKRSMNFHLDTGELLKGSAFTNGVLLVGDGNFSLVEREPRHFYTTSRPYAFPAERPTRPRVFDERLRDRLPDEDTRRAFWERLGATVAQELQSRQQIVALLGPGRTGKGTALRVVSMLIGEDHTASFTGGPIRLAKSQFSLAKLPNSDLILFPDIPAPPSTRGMAMDQYMEGLGIFKSIIGGDPIAVEQKHKDIITVIPNAAFWMDSNFDLSGFIHGKEDSFSWEERIVPIPFQIQLNEDEQEPSYQLRFKEELPKIAWHAVEAYTEAKARGSLTWSKEMVVAHAGLSQGKFGKLKAFFELLHTEPGTWMTRAEVSSAAGDFIGNRLDNSQRTSLYRYCGAINGVYAHKRRGVIGFKNLRVKNRGHI